MVHLPVAFPSRSRSNKILNALKLASQLSQAVKYNISQLIDLASNKHETAGLISGRLLPTIAKTSEVATVGAKSAELEEAQTQALARKQAADSTLHEPEPRITEYEKDAS